MNNHTTVIFSKNLALKIWGSGQNLKVIWNSPSIRDTPQCLSALVRTQEGN